MDDYEMFLPLVTKIIIKEGGFVNDGDDSGGATNFGVCLRDYKKFDPQATEETIRKLTKDQAIAYYKKLYWDPYPWRRISFSSVREKLFDLSIVLGYFRTACIFQRAINACYGQHGKVYEDGVIGTNTIAASDRCDAQQLLVAIRAVADGVFRMSVQENPKNAKYLKGWLTNRAYP